MREHYPLAQPLQPHAPREGALVPARTWARGHRVKSRALGAMAAVPPSNRTVAAVVRFRPTQDGVAHSSRCLADGCTVHVEGATRGGSARQFVVDRCFDGREEPSVFFRDSGAADLVDAALAGYSSTIFAFGPTGTGKTHTLAGAKGVPGMMHLAASHVFDRVAAAAEETTTVVRATFLEVYNEQVTDLICPGAESLPVRLADDGTFYVEDLSVVTCRGVKDLLEVIARGLSARHVRWHARNHESSRSHALLTLYVDSQPRAPSDGRSSPGPTYGKVMFLDLAGSENLRATRSEGAGMLEAARINRSLLSLGLVLKALSSTRARHVPVRDAVLTKLVADSLGGSARALMIACCAPEERGAPETARTLAYATAAAGITSKTPVAVRRSPAEQVLQELRAEVGHLRREVGQLRGQLQADGRTLAPDADGGIWRPRPLGPARSTDPACPPFPSPGDPLPSAPVVEVSLEQYLTPLPGCTGARPGATLASARRARVDLSALAGAASVSSTSGGDSAAKWSTAPTARWEDLAPTARPAAVEPKATAGGGLRRGPHFVQPRGKQRRAPREWTPAVRAMQGSLTSLRVSAHASLLPCALHPTPAPHPCTLRPDWQVRCKGR